MYEFRKFSPETGKVVLTKHYYFDCIVEFGKTSSNDIKHLVATNKENTAFEVLLRIKDNQYVFVPFGTTVPVTARGYKR